MNILNDDIMKVNLQRFITNPKTNEGVCIACRNQTELTEEHIFPQNVHGKIKPFVLCKKCNSEFGEKIDAAFRNSITTRLSGFQKGCIDDISTALAGVKGKLQNGPELVLSRQTPGEVLVRQSVSVEDTANGKVFKAIFPVEADDRRIEGKLKQVVSENFSGTYDGDALKNLTETIVKRGLGSKNIVRSDALIEIDVPLMDEAFAIALEYCKIAYEVSALTYTDKYLDSKTAIELRDILKTTNRERALAYVSRIHGEAVLDKFNERLSKRAHWAVVLGCYAYVSVWGNLMTVLVSDATSGFSVETTTTNAQFFISPYEKEIPYRICDLESLMDWLGL